MGLSCSVYVRPWPALAQAMKGFPPYCEIETVTVREAGLIDAAVTPSGAS